MTFAKAKQLAAEAAESSVLDADPSETTRLVALALVELAQALDKRLKDMQRDIATIKTKVQQMG